MSPIDEIIALYEADRTRSVSDLYESLAKQEKKSALGQYFTPPALADVLIEYAVRSADDLVLEPACGCASIASRISSKLVCVDRDPEVIRLSEFVLADRGAELHCADLFDFQPDCLFDAVVSNFPFVNKTKTDKSGRSSDWIRYNEIVKGDLRSMGFRFKKMSMQMDLCALCTMHLTRYLKIGGRMAIILSGGWVTTQYGVFFQEFLRNAFKIVAICESDIEQWFPYAEVNTCILFLERCISKQERDSNLVSFVRLRRNIKEVRGLAAKVMDLASSSKKDGMSLFADEDAEYTFYPQAKIHA